MFPKLDDELRVLLREDMCGSVQRMLAQLPAGFQLRDTEEHQAQRKGTQDRIKQLELARQAVAKISAQYCKHKLPAGRGQMCECLSQAK